MYEPYEEDWYEEDTLGYPYSDLEYLDDSYDRSRDEEVEDQIIEDIRDEAEEEVVDGQ